MIFLQKYLVEDILIHRETKQLVQVLDVFKDFDYYEYYNYEVMDLETQSIERRQQGCLEYKYASEKDINKEIHEYEREMNIINDKVSDLKWLKQTMRDKLKYMDNKGDSKRQAYRDTMTDVGEYKVVTIPEASKDDMLKEQYKFDTMGKDEWLVQEECNCISDKLEKLDDYYRRISKIKNGYKNRKK